MLHLVEWKELSPFDVLSWELFSIYCCPLSYAYVTHKTISHPTFDDVPSGVASCALANKPCWSQAEEKQLSAVLGEIIAVPALATPRLSSGRGWS